MRQGTARRSGTARGEENGEHQGEGRCGADGVFFSAILITSSSCLPHLRCPLSSQWSDGRRRWIHRRALATRRIVAGRAIIIRRVRRRRTTRPSRRSVGTRGRRRAWPRLLPTTSVARTRCGSGTGRTRSHAARTGTCGRCGCIGCSTSVGDGRVDEVGRDPHVYAVLIRRGTSNFGLDEEAPLVLCTRQRQHQVRQSAHDR